MSGIIPMLRFGYLPCDYHPMVLMLGESQDLRQLGGLLHRFAKENVDIQLERSVLCAPTDTSITLTRGGERRGMALLAVDQKSLVWSLGSEEALMFSDLLEELADPLNRSGSEMLMCGDISEIPVKVSRGEFRDEFLRIE